MVLCEVETLSKNMLELVSNLFVLFRVQACILVDELRLFNFLRSSLLLWNSRFNYLWLRVNVFYNFFDQIFHLKNFDFVLEVF